MGGLLGLIAKAGETFRWHIDFVMRQVPAMLIEQEVTTLYKEVHIARQMTGHPRRHRLLTTEM